MIKVMGLCLCAFVISTSPLWIEAAAVILATGVLIFTFHRYADRYLLAWAVGWICFTLHHRQVQSGGSGIRYWLIADLLYLLTFWSLGLGALLYVRRKQVPWLWMTLPALLTAGLLAAVYMFGNPWLPSLQLATYAVLAIASAVLVLRFTLGRNEATGYILAFVLAFASLHGTRFSDDSGYYESGLGILIGATLLLALLEGYQTRSRRLEISGRVTVAIANSLQSSAMLRAALPELRALTGASLACLRLLENGCLRLVEHIGVAHNEFRFWLPREVAAMSPLDFALLQQGASILPLQQLTPPELRESARRQHVDHLLIVPLNGKNGLVGTITLGFTRSRRYLPDELLFIGALGHQLGIAVESLGLFEHLVQSQRQWVNTFDSIADVIFVHDVDNHLMRANRAFFHRTGKKFDEAIGQVVGTLLPNVSSGCPYCKAINAAVTEDVDLGFGGTSIVSSSGYCATSADHANIVHVIKDTTERRKIQTQYLALMEGAQEGVVFSSPDGRLLDCNNAFVQMVGYPTREEVLRLSFDDVIANDQQRDAIRETFRKTGSLRNFEVTMRKADGTLVDTLQNGFVHRNTQGKIERYQTIVFDVTGKKRAEAELERRNRELRLLNDLAAIGIGSPDLQQLLPKSLRLLLPSYDSQAAAVWLLDSKTRILSSCAWVGPERLSAGPLSVELPSSLLELVTAERVEIVPPEYFDALPDDARIPLETAGYRKWDTVVLWSRDQPIGVLGIAPSPRHTFSEYDRNLLIAIGHQLGSTVERVRLYEQTVNALDQLQRAQEQLLQSEKMSSMGRMISGVAHELNNPLTAILGYSQLLEAELHDAKSVDYLGKLYKQAKRTQHIVQNLLSFSRQRAPMKTEIALLRVVEDTISLREYDFRLNNIKVAVDCEANLPPVIGDGQQLEQVFLNILNNACDAILERTAVGKVKIRLWHAEPDGHVCVSFHDSGPGIREPHRVFDPFYTTKKVGAGTGLGLSICYGIVREHGGEIRAFNHPQGGAVFQVCLPVQLASTCSVYEDGPNSLIALK